MIAEIKHPFPEIPHINTARDGNVWYPSRCGSLAGILKPPVCGNLSRAAYLPSSLSRSEKIRLRGTQGQEISQLPHQRRDCRTDYRDELCAYQHHRPAQVGLNAPEFAVVVVFNQSFQARQLVPDGVQMRRGRLVPGRTEVPGNFGNLVCV